MVAQQRHSLLTICDLIDKGDFEGLTQEVHRVNGLSAMIRDDAQELIGVLANPNMKVVRPEYN
jgi:predicted transcriptional regulator YheO